MVPRLALYGATSTALAAAVVGSAIHTRANFFAAAVTVGKSSGSLMVLANFALFNIICFGILLKKIFFGQLRSIEYEHLFERLWMFLTESLLALTIFRNDFSAPFAIMYSLLVFLKCFHWITADRVDYMDQVPPPGPPRLFHVRMTAILTLLACVDVILVGHSLESITFNGVSSMVLFASEFMIMLASIGGTTARYCVGLIDLRRARGRADAPSWEEKSMYLFYVDLTVDFIKLLTYLSFFTVILLHYGLPLHILRDVYMTFRSFLSRCQDLIRYRRATRDMNALYPNATAEELQAAGDPTCIICREEMHAQGQGGDGPQGSSVSDGPNETPKKLACGHIFHFHCLRSWLERQQSCPTCRRDVLRTPATTRRPAPAAPAAPGPGPLPGMPNPAQVPQNGQNPPNLFGPAVNPGVPASLQDLYNAALRANGQVPPLGLNGPLPRPTTTTPNQPQTEAERVQTGIWGGPITPGRFFASPLGAGPSRTGPSQPARRTAPPSISTVSPPSAPTTSSTATNSDSTSTTNETINTINTERSLPSANSFIQSGANTPFSSNPPQVFSIPSSSRARSPSPSSSETATPHNTSGDVDDEAPNSPAPVSEQERRKIAAEAAMRRLGFTTRTTAIPNIANAPDVKGKRKAVDLEGAPAPKERRESLEDPPRHIPYLTPISPLSLNQPLTGGNAPRMGGRSWMRSDADAVQGLDERIRVLQEVDEAIWGLMGELTKVKSSWETGHQTQAPRGGSVDHREQSDGSIESNDQRD